MNKVTIKACAHCGSHSDLINTSRWYKRGILFKIQCTGCGIQTLEQDFSGSLKLSLPLSIQDIGYLTETLILKWNKRIERMDKIDA